MPVVSSPSSVTLLSSISFFKPVMLSFLEISIFSPLMPYLMVEPSLSTVSPLSFSTTPKVTSLPSLISSSPATSSAFSFHEVILVAMSFVFFSIAFVFFAMLSALASTRVVKFVIFVLFSWIAVSCPSTRVVKFVIFVLFSWIAVSCPSTRVVKFVIFVLFSWIAVSCPSTRVVKFVIFVLLVSTCVFTSLNCLKLTASPSAAPAATLVIFLPSASIPPVVTDGPPVMVSPVLLIVTLSPDLNSSLVTLSSPVSVLFRLSL